MRTKLKILLAAVMILCCFAVACNDSGSDESGSEDKSTAEKTVTLDKDSLELDRFGEGMLVAESKSEGDEFIWISSDPETVSVDNGKLTALGEGECIITVRIRDSEASDTCRVTVKKADENPKLVLNISDNRLSMLKGASYTVKPALTYKGEEVADAVCTYRISKTEILSEQDGVFTALLVGETKVSVTAAWRGYKAMTTFDVTVNPNASLKILNGENEVVEAIVLRTSLPEGVDPAYIDSVRLTAAVTENGQAVESPEVVWTVEGDAVRCEDGKVIAVKAGEATVRAEYSLENGDKAVAAAGFSVVLPDLKKDVILAIDKTSPDEEIDFAALTEDEVLGMTVNGTEILNVDGRTIDAGWLKAQAEGIVDADVRTAAVIYHAKLKVTLKYTEVDLGNLSCLNIIEQKDGEAVGTNLPLGTLWDRAGEEDAAVTGDIEGVFKFHLPENRTQGFSNRVEFNLNAIGGTRDFIVYKAFIPEPGNFIGGWGKSDKDVWLDVNPDFTMMDVRGFMINADGVKSNKARRGEWITVVIKAGELNLNRFALMSCGGKKTDYYVRDMRFYSRENCDIPYTENHIELALNIGDTKEMDISMFKTGCVNSAELPAAITSVCSMDESVLTVEGNKITAVQGGTTELEVMLKAGKYELPVSVKVMVANKINDIAIDRSKTSLLASDEIQGDIRRVECSGEEIATSANIGDWLSGITLASVAPVEKTLMVTTDEGLYLVTVSVSDICDKVAKSALNIVDSNKLGTVWTSAGQYEGRENVYHYSSAKADGTASGNSIWNTRVDFGNNGLYQNYAYMAIEVRLTEGSGFDIWAGENGTHCYVKAGDNPDKFFIAYDGDGNRLNEFRECEWVTVVMNVKELMQKRCAFAQPDNTVCDYYIGDMTLWTKENFKGSDYALKTDREEIADDELTVIEKDNAMECWKEAIEYQGKAGVRHYAVETGDTWSARIDIDAMGLCGVYDYLAMEINVASGSSFDIWFGPGGGVHHELKAGSAIPEGFMVYDANGTKLDAFRDNEWVLAVIPSAELLANRHAFTKPNDVACDYYVGKLTCCTEAGLAELIAPEN